MIYLKALLLVLSIVLVVIQINNGLLDFDPSRFGQLLNWFLDSWQAAFHGGEEPSSNTMTKAR